MERYELDIWLKTRNRWQVMEIIRTLGFQVQKQTDPAKFIVDLLNPVTRKRIYIKLRFERFSKLVKNNLFYNIPYRPIGRLVQLGTSERDFFRRKRKKTCTTVLTPCKRQVSNDLRGASEPSGELTA